MSYTNANHLGVQHNEWLKSLDFYKNELDVQEKRLAEVASKNTAADVRTGIEHFQNQFIIQRNSIDELKHDIREHSHQAFEDVKNHVGRVGEAVVDTHQEIAGRVAQSEKILNELRQEFKLWLAKWM